jgi:hypothetical protein
LIESERKVVMSWGAIRGIGWVHDKRRWSTSGSCMCPRCHRASWSRRHHAPHTLVRHSFSGLSQPTSPLPPSPCLGTSTNTPSFLLFLCTYVQQITTSPAGPATKHILAFQKEIYIYIYAWIVQLAFLKMGVWIVTWVTF